MALVQLAWLSLWKRIKDDAVFHPAVAPASDCSPGQCYHIPQPLFAVRILKGADFHTAA